MKLLQVALLAGAGLLAGVGAKAQTADEIVSKHIEAMGGKEKIAGIKTVYTEYDMEVMGNQASGVTNIVNGKGFRNDVDFGGQKIVECVTDTKGWSQNPMQGQTAPEAMPDELVKSRQSQLQVGGPLFDYAAKGNKVELAGKENVGSVSAYKLKVITKDGSEQYYFIDPATYYIIKSVISIKADGQSMETATVYSNHKKTDYGYVVPGSAEITLPQGITLVLTTKKTEINKDIDPKIFDMQ